jgi:hypothetical protein
MSTFFGRRHCHLAAVGSSIPDCTPMMKKVGGYELAYIC